MCWPTFGFSPAIGALWESVRRFWLTCRSRKLAGHTFGEAVNAVRAPAPCARAALLHLLWRQELRIDLRAPLQASTVLLAGVRS